MPRQTVKLLLVDESGRVLLIRHEDRVTGLRAWYPVGGGIEGGESLQQAAEREAYEEVGLEALTPGVHVWTRDHTYEYDGRTVDVHEDWLLHRVGHFSPAPARLSDHEAATVRGFRWWSSDELRDTADTVFPPALGDLLAGLLRDGVPRVVLDISSASAG
ncbi:DNA mismatch repair protein MutT [Nocardioides flavus (ex Wang et al. 2016)]|uniref:DNA mismatch repair protein MutT n=1 Tax=Nocardioides flavus (ex Wang et al. 2016) TaxID=2058780 RepID=A0ABQ3HPQ0_9ACTN|nr:NUDIX domain-containing protein [Nocardioides flavus (ex Wang et al. 2016)]GHE18873.1 DNA mismatch repair protein MutT [Nocardioides flavus (ex Wang et al. 2016)]